MAKIILNGIGDFISNVGKQLGWSNWLEINQDMINQFADLTLDRQWIHTDSQKANKQSPYGTTIAHGFFVMSLFTHFLDEVVEVRNVSQVLNYKVENLIFKKPVPASSRVRMTVTLNSAKDFGNICKATYQCRFEVEGNENPVVEGSLVFLYYFESELN